MNTYKYKSNNAAMPSSFMIRIILLESFFYSLLFATSNVSVNLFGKYTIDYSPDTIRIFIATILTALLAISLPKQINRIDRLLIMVLTVISGVPMLVPYAIGGANPEWMITTVLFWSILGLQTRFNLGGGINFIRLKGGWWWLALVLGVITIYVLVTAILFVGITPNINFSRVYAVRDIFISSKIPFANYFYKWTAYVVVPLIFSVGWSRRNKLLLFISFAIALVLFFSTGMKADLFVIPFVSIMYFIWMRKHPESWLIIGLTLMVLSSVGSYHILNDKRLNATFSNRMFILPAKISYEYYEYFSDNPSVKLSNSIFSSFMQYPYSNSPAHMISGEYYGNTTDYPNTGILGDAYMNFRLLGVCVLFILTVITLRLIGELSKGKDEYFAIALVIMPIFTWVNSGFFTSFLTAGLLFGLCGLWLLPKKLPIDMLSAEYSGVKHL